MLRPEDFFDDALKIGCEVAAIRAVAEVESRGGGFDPEGFPKTLFEGHWFYRLTKGKYATVAPDLCYPKWTKQFYGKGWLEEKVRLARACELDRTAALQSASWGMFQIMGFNHVQCGFKTVQQFVNAMCASEDSQLAVFTQYIINTGLAKYLIAKDWASFAHLYNGPEYTRNQYDKKLGQAYTKYS